VCHGEFDFEATFSLHSKRIAQAYSTLQMLQFGAIITLKLAGLTMLAEHKGAPTQAACGSFRKKTRYQFFADRQSATATCIVPF
jgi:hypothetical protein